jgi:acetyl-CoA acetyltransferase
MRDVYVIGAGMTKFEKALEKSLKDLTGTAVLDALQDAGVTPGQVEAAYVGNAVAGLVTGQEMIRGQVLLRPIGFQAIPIFNVENACASASTALHLGWQAVATGIHDIVLCLGAEKLTHEDKTRGMAAIGTAVDVEATAAEAAAAAEGTDGGKPRSYFMDLYAGWTREYMERSGATQAHFAGVVVKNQHNGALNPRAQYGAELTVDEVLADREVVWPLTLRMCSPISDGAAAVILASEEAMQRLGADGPRVLASILVSGNNHDSADPTAGSAGRAAKLAYEAAGLGPEDLDCIEVHDATAPAELMIYEYIGLANPGEGPALLDSGATRLGGRVPVNTSGGLLSKGHPIGATGIAQICEATWQLRGLAGGRQVEGAKIAMTQNGGGWLDDDSAAMSVHILEAVR